MYSHPLTADIQKWWETHGADHKSEQWQAYLKELQELILVKCNEIGQAHENAGRFGMSGAGGCTRRAVLSLLGYEGEPHTGDSLVTFHIGHLLESVPIATLKVMGYEVEGLQEPIKVDPYMQSYTDGIIRSGPRTDIPYPCLLSVKTNAYKMSYYNKKAKKFVRNGFPALPFDGVRVKQGSWWCQSQMEMRATGIPNSMVVVIAKDIVQAFKNDEWMQSLSFYCELLIEDAETQRLLDNAWTQAWQRAEDKAQITDIPPLFYGTEEEFVELPEPGHTELGWRGPNQDATGSFNPCFGCGFNAVCEEAEQSMEV